MTVEFASGASGLPLGVEVDECSDFALDDEDDDAAAPPVAAALEAMSESSLVAMYVMRIGSGSRIDHI